MPLTTQKASESEMILAFFDEDLAGQYDIYHHFRSSGHAVASEMRKEIERQVKECPEYLSWWREVLAEESFADFSNSQGTDHV